MIFADKCFFIASLSTRLRDMTTSTAIEYIADIIKREGAYSKREGAKSFCLSIIMALI